MVVVGSFRRCPREVSSRPRAELGASPFRVAPAASRTWQAKAQPAAPNADALAILASGVQGGGLLLPSLWPCLRGVGVSGVGCLSLVGCSAAHLAEQAGHRRGRHTLPILPTRGVSTSRWASLPFPRADLSLCRLGAERRKRDVDGEGGRDNEGTKREEDTPTGEPEAHRWHL